MNAARRRKLLVTLSLLMGAGVIIALVLYSLRQNINLFYSPTQIVQGDAPLHHGIRAGGMVVAKSVVRSSGDLTVHFKITDFQHTINVTYRGILPDLFREGQGVIVQGELLDQQHFNAKEVLAKHDEKYMPPEVTQALNQAKRPT